MYDGVQEKQNIFFFLLNKVSFSRAMFKLRKFECLKCQDKNNYLPKEDALFVDNLHLLIPLT